MQKKVKVRKRRFPKNSGLYFLKIISRVGR